jgi:hypothetical protein
MLAVPRTRSGHDHPDGHIRQQWYAEKHLIAEADGVQI